MDITIRLAVDADKEQFMAVFNYYTEHGYAAYSSRPIPVEAFERFKAMCREGHLYVAETDEQKIVGFAMLKTYFNTDCFARTAEVGYFILPDYTNQGIGNKFMITLTQAAQSMGIAILTANVSSLNPQSLAFHIRQGFRQVGRLENVGEKHERLFDVIWFQKSI